jgi:hypothetical protein
MIFAEESSRPEDRRCLRFKCSSFYELNAVNTLPVHDLSAVNDYILRFKYSSTPLLEFNQFRVRRRRRLPGWLQDRPGPMSRRTFRGRSDYVGSKAMESALKRRWSTPSDMTLKPT